jgi:hypothetical protein
MVARREGCRQPDCQQGMHTRIIHLPRCYPKSCRGGLCALQPKAAAMRRGTNSSKQRIHPAEIVYHDAPVPVQIKCDSALLCSEKCTIFAARVLCAVVGARGSLFRAREKSLGDLALVLGGAGEKCEKYVLREEAATR